MSETMQTSDTKNLDFIKTIAEIGEPFNSNLLDGYQEYEKNKEAYINDTAEESFLAILNKIGEDGCKILTDRIVNYINDISNIDTTIPKALLSQANSIGYPYKDKKIVEQLNKLSKCSPLLQLLVWTFSTNARNSKNILRRLGFYSENDYEFPSNNIKEVFDNIRPTIKNLFLNNFFKKRYLYLDSSAEQKVVSNDSPALLDFSWIVNTIFSDEIVKDGQKLARFSSHVIDFGKYNRTIYADICYEYLYSKIYSSTSDYNNVIRSVEDDLTPLAKSLMPFIFNNNLFDPLQAAWSIVYDSATIDDFDERYHQTILEFKKIFSEKLNSVAFNAMIDFLDSTQNSQNNYNSNLVLKLNANSFTYQQTIVQFINDVKMLFAINIDDFTNTGIHYSDDVLAANSNYWESIGNSRQTSGFAYLSEASGFSLVDKINWSTYIDAILENIFNIGTKIRNLREDLRIMTLRNSYKGTTALIQFAVFEYLNDCLEDLVRSAQDQYNMKLSNSEQPIQLDITSITSELQKYDQTSIAVGEYWDYTEYFNRIDNDEEDTCVDWHDPGTEEKNNFIAYGSMDDDEIFDFYTKVLNVPKEIYVDTNEGLDAEDPEEFVKTELAKKKLKLREFLKTVYNTGVFTKRTNSNYEAKFSGNIKETTNDSPWVAYKNSEFISKEVHPYIWNFSNKLVRKMYKSNAVTVALQNLEYEIVAKHIGLNGNIIDQYRLSKNFVDSSGYITRYENRNHNTGEYTQSYDGIVYPKFAFDLINGNISNENFAEIEKLWYTDQEITLSDSGKLREKYLIKKLEQNDDFQRSVNGINHSSTDTSIKNVLKDYCLDKYETTYAISPYKPYKLIYKENGYPFMRPLIAPSVKLTAFTGNMVDVNPGMLFVNADNSIDEDITDVNYDDIKNDKFPRIVISEDGTHVLIRTGKNELRSYNVTTHKNNFNEIVQALQLNYIITCDDIIFKKEFFNDSLIKTIDDIFYILVPYYDSDDEEFCNYLFYIENKRNDVLVSKEKFTGTKRDNLFRSGLILNNGENVIANTFYVDKDQKVGIEDATDISAVYSPETYSENNNQTVQQNWRNNDSSFDVLNQFVQVYSSQIYNSQNRTMMQIPVSRSATGPLSSHPTIDLRISSIKENWNSELNNFTTEIAADEDGYLDKRLWASTKLPVIRTFNLNSDAGFNPIYIGDKGKIILQNRKSQLAKTKSTGAAFELLGPKNDFKANPDEIEDDPFKGMFDDDIGFGRIHEFYSFTDETEVSSFAASFDKSNNTDEDGNRRNTSYRYGYTSVVEKEENKKDVYRIKDIKTIKLDSITTNDDVNVKDYVSGTLPAGTKINIDNKFEYHRIYIFIKCGNILYSLIPRKQNTYLQKFDKTDAEFYKIMNAINGGNGSQPYSIRFKDTYVIDEIKFNNPPNNSSSIRIDVYGSAHELINSELYLVHVESNKFDTRISNDDTENNAQSNAEISAMSSPNFMLSREELRNSLIASKITDNLLDYHLRIPHMNVTADYRQVKTASNIDESKIDLSDETLVSSGSLVFSITEMDSDLLNTQMPDQWETNDLKSVTVEALNDYFRYDYLKSHSFDELCYEFKPWQIVDLYMKRDIDDNTDIGYDNENNQLDKHYIVQPYHGNIKVSQNASNKYTISFWRRSEPKTTPKLSDTPENVLPKDVKVTEISGGRYRPIYSNEHESIFSLLNEQEFVPQLMVQWEYGQNQEIKLRFNNAINSDSPFINPESMMEYKSMSVFKDAVELEPGKSAYIDIVAPCHIVVGMTVFYNIPIMRAFVTNISDDKPKFMLTILNDRTDEQVAIESNNYALVFTTAETPQITNSDIVYVTAYVAPMISINQQNPPSISNAITMSELSFNFDIANLINRHEFGFTNSPTKSLIEVEHVNAITNRNKISTTAKTYINYTDSMHQIRVSEPYGKVDDQGQTINYDGFCTLNLKLNLSDMADYTLKNILCTAHGDVIAYDNDNKACSIVKIFGCSLDRIGAKHVLGVNYTNNILTSTQASGRETALLVNPSSIETTSYVYRYRSNFEHNTSHYYSLSDSDPEMNEENWTLEGPRFYALNDSLPKSSPIYVLYKNNIGYFYTINKNEYNRMKTSGSGWTDKGIAFYGYKTKGENRIPVYHFEREDTMLRTDVPKAYLHHFYTTSKTEIQDYIEPRYQSLWKMSAQPVFYVPSSK